MGLRRSIKQPTLEEFAQGILPFWHDLKRWLAHIEREIPPGRKIRYGSREAMLMQATLELIDDARPRIVAKLEQVQTQETNGGGN